MAYWNNLLPEQADPFPVYPESQAHVKLPSVLVHVAFMWQVWMPSEHSSISKMNIISKDNSNKKNKLSIKIIYN